MSSGPAAAPWPPGPLTLEGEWVALEPLTAGHAAGLRDAAADGRLWELWYTIVPAPDAIDAWIETALAQQRAGRAVPFAVRRKRDSRIVGSTRYMNVEEAQRRLEIGTTWYSASVQKTGLNTECKRLLLAHAFDALGCIAVEFRTHWFNHASREAIARLGAKQDGVLRNHQRLPDGSLRDTVVFSVIDVEWPAVRRHLAYRQQRLSPP
ncbi:MAG TPA: GNAT family N-acetyltransferase [Burkholderiaceae bacterium]|nr:GNAT family N-acetyltransferase [Burkholderiaceae bacterium]